MYIQQALNINHLPAISFSYILCENCLTFPILRLVGLLIS